MSTTLRTNRRYARQRAAVIPATYSMLLRRESSHSTEIHPTSMLAGIYGRSIARFRHARRPL